MNKHLGVMLGLLLVASNNAYGEDKWSSHDFASQIWLRMSQAKPQRFLFDSTLLETEKRGVNFLSEVSLVDRLERLRPRLQVNQNMELIITDDPGRIALCFVWRF